ncbi:hypothetical protein [Deinococcus peraridilitoris]|uniref:Uncharacterized protein n=1 Tax=Deinococcus peraridilitoris (strain DSM 19664 / LMG 22246 / CIP 109416 / KR-200) TaxID=937777 RepID=L0A284_DEIPD|nr:hypothetical protein [Deinococcus peraridilitoris]AFZ68013.1 hypothetical protein Deipe_2548 [Deinococcus peraridilitoris DSM 19664]
MNSIALLATLSGPASNFGVQKHKMPFWALGVDLRPVEGADTAERSSSAPEKHRYASRTIIHVGESLCPGVAAKLDVVLAKP